MTPPLDLEQLRETAGHWTPRMALDVLERLTEAQRVANEVVGAFQDRLQEQRERISGLLDLGERWAVRAGTAEKALRDIAELPEPMNNKGAAQNQCEWLKEVAREALRSAGGALPKPDPATAPPVG